MSSVPQPVYYAAVHARGLNPSIEELELERQSWLTEEEKIKIKEVMVREKEFTSNETQGRMKNKNMEGQLSKFTNLVKGWQNRWFALDAEHGTLTYYLERDKVKNGPRGSVHLSGAVIAPSDEDSSLFTVNASNGDVYKLRTTDAKSRQHWVNMIRAVAEFHSLSPRQQPAADVNPASIQRSASLGGAFLSKSSAIKRTATYAPSATKKPERPQPPKQITTPAGEELHNVKDALNTVDEYHATVVETLENGSQGDLAGPLDENVLVLKATSQAMVNILHQCYSILNQQASDLQASAHATGLPPGARIEWLEPSDPMSGSELRNKGIGADDDFTSDEEQGDEDSLREEEFTHIRSFEHSEVLDTNDFEESDESMEPHRNMILSILSQLKLGMDLTRVVLPTFVLEKRSLLEMYADFFAHPHLFTRIPDAETPQDRMLAVVEFYLTSFHVGRKSPVAKKPYNPIIGETFHCSYDVSDCKTSSRSQSNTPVKTVGESTDRLFYVAEQVSHHPPISAFYAESPEKRISMNAHIWTKSKFYGMSIGVVNVGEGVIIDHVHEEEYIITFPNAYCRSILTYPWVELGGRTMIKCVKSGYATVVLFHTKPFYGGTGNKISAEIKNVQTGDIFCRAEGSWNGNIDFIFTDEGKDDSSIDTKKLPIIPKRVRPIEKQGEFESRRLWRDVTVALTQNNLEAATAAKHKLEERQRAEEKQRQSLDIKWKTKLFHKVDDGWWFNKHVKQRRKTRCSTSS